MKNYPPEDLNSENFIIGGAKRYDFVRIAVATDDAREFRIDPGPMPIPWMAGNCCLVVGFLAGLVWISRRIGQVPWYVYALFAVLGLFNCLMFTVIPFLCIRYEKKCGSWLIYDKLTRRVRLPRQEQKFDLKEIVYLQYITTKRLKPHSGGDNGRLTELNLVTCKNGERKRWQLLGSSKRSGDPFAYLLRPLARYTEIPVMRFTNPRNGWDVTVEKYVADGVDER